MQFIDLKKQYSLIKSKIDKSVENVIENGNFIQGEEVKTLESKLSEYVGTNCVTCANGTDALYIALRALGVKAGDEIIVPSFTWISTAGVVKLLDAIPIFADIEEDTFNISVKDIENKITNKTKAIIPVSIFGRSCEIIEICELAHSHNIPVIEDSAQGFGSKYKGIMSCSYADISTTSFFPAKPLGCYGDGGAIFCKNNELFEKIKAITKHGQKGRYNYVDIGMNSRLDTIQAAILLEKLKIYENEIIERNRVANKYNHYLVNDLIIKPSIPTNDDRSVWAQYTILLEKSISNKRDKIMEKMKAKNIPTALYYPAPLHLQKPFYNNETLPVTESISKRVLSLPMHPYLNDDEIKLIASTLSEVIEISR